MTTQLPLKTGYQAVRAQLERAFPKNLAKVEAQALAEVPKELADECRGGDVRDTAFSNFNAVKLGAVILRHSLIVGLLSAGVFFAMPKWVAAQSIRDDLICSTVGQLATVTFELRQNGMERTFVEGMTSQDFGNDIQPVVNITIDLAFAYPIISDDEARENITASFEQSIEMICLDQLSNPSTSTQDERATSTGDESPQAANEVDESAEVPDWADPNYPEIDYSGDVSRVLHERGYTFSGYWAVMSDTDEISSEDTTYALNASDWMTDPSQMAKGLTFACVEGVTKVLAEANNYITLDSGGRVTVAYRIDGGEAVETRWRAMSTAARGEGEQAEAFLRALIGSSRLFLRVTEGGGERHDFNLQTQGISEAAEILADACQFSLLDLSREDLRRVQTLLNAEGYNAGSPDGIWGRGSKRALSQFQEDRGLEQTGIVDAASLSALDF